MNKNIFLLFLFSAGLTQGASAQLLMGFQLGGNKMYPPSQFFIGPGVSFDYPLDKKSGFIAGANYMFTRTRTYTITANAYNSATMPQVIEIPAKNRLSMLHFYYDYKRYFGKGTYGKGGIYWALGAGLIMIPINRTLGDYDTDKYLLSSRWVYKGIIHDVAVSGTIGYEKWSHNRCFFSELKLNYTSGWLSYNILASASLNAGIRFNLSN